MGSPSPSTLKSLGAVCGNVCAFPGCIAPIFDTVHEKLLGEVCHIEADGVKGPRYRKEQPEPERQGFGNLILMCQPHHTIIDDPATVGTYTVEVLKGYKRDHEGRSQNTTMSEAFLAQLVLKVIELQAATQPVLDVAAIVEAHRVSQDNNAGIDHYQLTAHLVNNSNARVREYTIEVEIPKEFMPERSGTFAAEDRHHNRGNVRVFRATEQQYGGAVLPPRGTNGYHLTVPFEVMVQQYIEITGNEVITVTAYAGDSQTSQQTLRIADFLSQDRINMIWPDEWRRPEVLRG